MFQTPSVTSQVKQQRFHCYFCFLVKFFLPSPAETNVLVRLSHFQELHGKHQASVSTSVFFSLKLCLSQTPVYLETGDQPRISCLPSSLQVPLDGRAGVRIWKGLILACSSSRHTAQWPYSNNTLKTTKSLYQSASSCAVSKENILSTTVKCWGQTTSNNEVRNNTKRTQ